ncbi:WXG100 family type VII secretion target [Streptococcus oriscaviae]|uniref:ESAT-6-like protein n=1 Tax=Streptococcus oriscaviae TaxID=2781599 RepID=A0ABX7YNN8_9STRE|nr:WXG100 family type VII secretion target [Streptococcus oriscaviae]QUE55191.1 WXG100 family type VII secretion target [Streptococcus oriscaviae]
MSQISLTPEQLVSQAQIYKTASAQIDAAIQSVNRANSEIGAQWKGQAFQAYLEQYVQLEGNVKQMEALLESINVQLNQYAQTVAARDAQDAKSFGLH